MILLSKKKPKTDGKRGRVFSVWVVRVGVVTAVMRDWSLGQNSGSFYGIRALIDGPSAYVTMLGDDSRSRRAACLFPRFIDCIGRRGPECIGPVAVSGSEVFCKQFYSKKFAVPG